MADMSLDSNLVLFVTHVVAQGPLLKIWGQVDRNAATYVERLILPLTEEFVKGRGLPGPIPSPLGLPVLGGTVCCAKFQKEGYYRAKILNVNPNGGIVTQFIDYGNVEILSLEAIRLLDGIPNSEALRSLPPLAHEYVLANVMPVNGTWDNETVDSIRQSLRYVELKGVVVTSMYGNFRLLKLCYNNQDFGDLLVSKNLAVNIPSQEMQRQQTLLRRPNTLQSPQREQQYPVNKNDMPDPYPQTNYNWSHQSRNNYPPSMSYGQANVFHENWRSPQQSSVPQQQVIQQQSSAPQQQVIQQQSSVPQQQVIQQQSSVPQQQVIQQQSPVYQSRLLSPAQHPQVPVQEALVYKSRVLEVGSMHDVCISNVEDGPLKFSVQLNSTAEVLKMLMIGINDYPRQPLQEHPLPGFVCLGPHTRDKALCRAVVMAVMETKCKLYYVDFGHTEVLPYTDIFQLPAAYINPKVLSMIFTLSGLKDLKVTPEMKERFKQIVTGKTLLLNVRPPEGPPLIQYGDLYDNGKNIRDLLKEACPISPLRFQKPMYPPKGFNEIVHVSFVESCTKFFVQPESGIKSLNSIMACLAEYATTAPPLNPGQIQVGLPCTALYEEDGTWYRAQILGHTGDKVKVLYVDYGNEETVTASALRAIHEDLVSNLKSQAMQCMLNGYQSVPFNQELANQFELLILEKRLNLVVVEMLQDGVLVDLFDPASSPMVNICSQLKKSMENVTAEKLNSTIESQNESRSSNNTKSPYSRNQRSDAKVQESSAAQHQKGKTKNTKGTRDDTNRNQDTSSNWGRNNSSKATSNWSTAGGDSSFEKPKSKNWKEDENENRRWNNRSEKGGQDSDKFGAPRFNRDGPKNDRFAKSDTNDRYERNETSSGRDRGGRGGGSRSENRFDKDKVWSDKDSDTSSRGSGGRRQGGRGRDGGRGGGSRNQGGKWGDNDSDKGGYKGSRHNSDRNGGFQSRDRKLNDGWENDKPSKIGTWDSMSPSSSPKRGSSVQKCQIPSPNITVGAVKNCDIVFIASPTDFYVQLSPDNLELDRVMANIAANYETGGTVLARSMIQAGTDCVAQYAEDLKWYRAVIKANNGTNAGVHFVDYGNTETVEFDKIKEITIEFAKLPAQAIHCKLLAASKTEWFAEEIEEFTNLTDGRALEAEFMAQTDGSYDVMLREVVDSVPQATYINEKFSGGADLMQAKNSARNKGSNSARTSRLPPDYAPITQKWSEPTMSLDSREDVLVTWFIDPENFYCQMIRKQAEFRTMMNDIQKVYCGRPPLTDTLQVGTAVIAFFSDDGALYRAEIKELNRLRGHIVRYVDFGNCAMVDTRKIYPVEKKFMVLPKQAVHCALRNIAPAVGTDWSKANKNEIDKFFDADKHQCTVHGMEGSKYSISLNNNGIDVAESMVTKGLARRPVSSLAAVDTGGVGVVEADVQRVDISLFEGQALRVKISNVEGVSAFHIQLPSATATQETVTEHLANKDPQVMPRLSCREVCLGAGCLVYSEDVWRRAVVTDCSRTTGFDVRLIDTGARDEIPVDCMIALPGQLSVKQNQAVECCLQNVSTSLQLDERLKRLIENKDMIVDVQEVDHNRLIVQLYDTAGSKLKLLETDADDSISPVCPLPIYSSTHKVWVSHADHSGSIWLQMSVDSDSIARLLGALFQHYAASGEACAPEVGKLCAAQGQDQNWYRAEIIDARETGVLVKFIDYGNSEEVSSDVIKVLEPQFHTPSRLAINVSLMVVLHGAESEQQAMLEEHLMDKEFTATFYNVKKSWMVELVEGEQKLSDKLAALGLVKELKKVQPAQPSLSEMIVGGRYDVFVTHTDSPAQFWLQRSEEAAAVEIMQAELQVAAPTYQPIEGVPEEGTLCTTVYSADNQWYRAEVLDADEDITTVRFVDYGNTDIIDNKSGNIRQLPDTWKAVKKYGIRCRLDVIPVGADDWSEVTCEKFETLADGDGIPIQALVIADSNPRRVELFVGDKSIGETLVQEGHAVMVHNAEDLIDEIVDLELDPHSAFVSHVNSPAEFWVQEEKSVSDLEVISDRFMVADMFPKLEEVREGCLCVAKFPDDEQWYRARVKSCGDAGIQVIYIDYGNSAVSTEVRTIPEDLAAVPPLSRKCCLPLPKDAKEWSSAACEKFAELAADGATIFILEVLKDDETSIVNLTLEGVSIVDQLALLCERELPVAEERLPPLGEENSPNVVVSHVNSPSRFWTQAESSIAELEVMAHRLAEAQSFLPLDTFEVGTVCAAKFPEDGQWYRASILAHGETGTEVLYIDYGNSAVTKELRILPEDIVNLPSLSKYCSLRLPEGADSWSEAACKRFLEMVADGATMFRFQILDNEVPMHINLNLEGKDVVEVLAPLCTGTMEDVVQGSSGEVAKETEVPDAKGSEAEATEGVETSVKTEIVVTEAAETEVTGGIEALKTELEATKDTEVKATEAIPCEGTGKTETKVTEEISSEVTKDTVVKVAEEIPSRVAEEIAATNLSEEAEASKEAVIEDEDTIAESQYASLQNENLVSPTSLEMTASDIAMKETDLPAASSSLNPVADETTGAEATETVEAHQEIGEAKELDEVIAKNVNVVAAIEEETISDEPVENEVISQKPGEDERISEEPSEVETISEKPSEAETISQNTAEAERIPPNPAEEEETSTRKPAETETISQNPPEDKTISEKPSEAETISQNTAEAERIPPNPAEEEETSTRKPAETEAISQKPADRKDHPVIPDNLSSNTVLPKTPKMNKIVPGSVSRGISQEEIAFSQIERRNSIPREEKIVPGSINKGTDLTESESFDSSGEENLSKPPTKLDFQPDSGPESSVPPTLPKTDHSDKIVPGCVSRGESPGLVEPEPPSTPKTPHSEKLVAGAVNPQMAECLPEFEEQDEVLIIETEDNIPKYAA